MAAIEEQVRGALADLPMRALYVRVVQPGRTTYAMVHVLLGEAEIGLDIKGSDALRRAVVAARYTPVIVDIIEHPPRRRPCRRSPRWPWAGSGRSQRRRRLPHRPARPRAQRHRLAGAA